MFFKLFCLSRGVRGGLPGEGRATRGRWRRTGLLESRETSATGSELQGELGKRNKDAAEVFKQGTCKVENQMDPGQDKGCREGWVIKLRRWKSLQEGTRPRGLPRSRTAVVKTSLKGRRETGTRRIQQTGERGENRRGTADILAQARLHEREAWLSLIRSGDAQCCVWTRRWCCRGACDMKRMTFSEGLTKYQTRDILGWRKGVG